jgi:hypothetical protein
MLELPQYIRKRPLSSVARRRTTAGSANLLAEIVAELHLPRWGIGSWRESCILPGKDLH